MKGACDIFNELLDRVCPDYRGRISGEIRPEEAGGFRVADAPGGGIRIVGGNALELAAGLNAYCKERLGWHDSWCGSRADFPAELPVAGAALTRRFPLALRPYFNYCTFGYSMVWWTWEEWRREIDRMALNGINLPLAVTGLEAVWAATFRRFGLSDDEVRGFLSGPAFLPWQYMNNINSHAGPLPQSWIDDHAELGRRIVERERAWGMEPILPGFNGHVPEAFVRLHPEVKIIRSCGWCHFAPVSTVDPTDPMFGRITAVFMEELERILGRSRYISIDLFHEQEMSGMTPEYYASCGRGVAASLTAANPEAIWVMQAWSERADIIHAVPREHLLLLDIGKERLKETGGLYGIPTVWGTIHSFGGQTEIGGDLAAIPREIAAQRKAYPNLVGAGAFPESIYNNPVLFELVWDAALRGGELKLDEWLGNYLHRRYGAVPDCAAEAWRRMLRDVYTARRGDPVFAARPALTLDRANAWAGFQKADTSGRFFPAWEKLLEAGARRVDTDGYRFDVIDLGRQALSGLGQEYFRAVQRAYRAGDAAAFGHAADEFLTLLEDCDRLLATRKEFRLDEWIASARRHGKTAAEKALYEFNARLQLTLWGPVSRPEPLFDYCCREWSGLLRDYYGVRWRLFFAFLGEKLARGERYDDAALPRLEGRITLDANEFYRELYGFERQFAGTVSDDAALARSCAGRGDELETARSMFAKYRSRSTPAPETTHTGHDLPTGFAVRDCVTLS